MDGEGTSGMASIHHSRPPLERLLQFCIQCKEHLKRPERDVILYTCMSTSLHLPPINPSKAWRGAFSSQAISSPAAGRCAAVDRGVLKQTSPCRVWLVSSSSGNLLQSPYPFRFAQQMASDLPTIRRRHGLLLLFVDSLRQGWRCQSLLGLVGCLIQQIDGASYSGSLAAAAVGYGVVGFNTK